MRKVIKYILFLEHLGTRLGGILERGIYRFFFFFFTVYAFVIFIGLFSVVSLASFAFCVAVSVPLRIERDFPTENEGRSLVTVNSAMEKYEPGHGHALLHRVSE